MNSDLSSRDRRVLVSGSGPGPASARDMPLTPPSPPRRITATRSAAALPRRNSEALSLARVPRPTPMTSALGQAIDAATNLAAVSVSAATTTTNYDHSVGSTNLMSRPNEGGGGGLSRGGIEGGAAGEEVPYGQTVRRESGGLSTGMHHRHRHRQTVTGGGAGLLSDAALRRIVDRIYREHQAMDDLGISVPLLGAEESAAEDARLAAAVCGLSAQEFDALPDKVWYATPLATTSTSLDTTATLLANTATPLATTATVSACISTVYPARNHPGRAAAICAPVTLAPAIGATADALSAAAPAASVAPPGRSLAPAAASDCLPIVYPSTFAAAAEDCAVCMVSFEPGDALKLLPCGAHPNDPNPNPNP